MQRKFLYFTLLAYLRSMKKHIPLFLLTLPVWLSFIACSNEPDVPPTPDPHQPDTVDHELIIYMEAQNSLWDYAYKDLDEIASAQAQIPSNSRITVFLDDYSREGKQQYPSIFCFTSKGRKELYKYDTQLESTDSATMVSVLQRIMKLSPARRYSLVLWSHGSGWVPAPQKAPTRSFGSDNNGLETDIPVLRGVLENFPTFEYILFDACFMQSIEVAFELRHTAQWIIGSPAEIPAQGAPYDKALRSLCTANIEGIVKDYHNAYQEPEGAPLSAICTSRLDALARTTADVLPPIFTGRTEPFYIGIQRYCGLLGKTETFGMKSAMYHLLNDEAYARWVKVFDWAVPIQSPVNSWTTRSDYDPPALLTDPEHYGGVSVFLPSSAYDNNGYNAFFQTYQWYEAAGWKGTGW